MINSGEIFGDVSLGGGNDTYRAIDDGSVEGTISGEDGDDTLKGGSGDDVMTGGNGADDFVILRDNGNDRITDFADGIDEIDISAYGILAADFATAVAPALTRVTGRRKTRRSKKHLHSGTSPR